MMAQYCENARKELRSPAVMPPLRARTSAFRQDPRADVRHHSESVSGSVMHDFSQIRVHLPSGRAELHDDSACASGRFGKNGGTGCDASTGKTVTTIYDPPPCYRHCVERHEAVHARDIAPCCTRANVAYKAAKSDDDRQAVQDKFDNWMLSNEDWLECRAYTESAKCGKEYVDQNCGRKKQDAGAPQDVSGVEAAPPVSLEPFGASQSKAIPAAGETIAPMRGGMLAEDKPDGGAGSPGPTEKPDAGAGTPGPEQCCRQLLCYWRISQGRADNVCQRAPKALSRCPF
jgi:hypothetical protein